MCKIILHICPIYVAFELTIDFGILLSTFATALVIFVLILITLGNKFFVLFFFILIFWCFRMFFWCAEPENDLSFFVVSAGFT